MTTKMRLLVVAAALCGVVVMLGCGVGGPEQLRLVIDPAAVEVGQPVRFAVWYGGQDVTSRCINSNTIGYGIAEDAFEPMVDYHGSAVNPGSRRVKSGFVPPDGVWPVVYAAVARYQYGSGDRDWTPPAYAEGKIYPRGGLSPSVTPTPVPSPTPTPSPAQVYVDPSNPVLVIGNLTPGIQIRVIGPGGFDSGLVTVAWDGTAVISGLQYGGIYTVLGPDGQVILTIEVLGLLAPPGPTPCPTATPTPEPTAEPNAGAAVHIHGGDGR